MEKGKMIAKDVHISSSDSESEEMEMSRAPKLNLKRGREDSNCNTMKDEPSKRTRYHRHIPQQIHEMEKLFKDCPHPSDKQRRELSLELGMKPTQIKFWFQNKRNQLKAQHAHLENIQLRIMNDKLQAKNAIYKDALYDVLCASCGGLVGIGEMSLEELQLKRENDALRKEISRISTIAARYVGKPLSPP